MVQKELIPSVSGNGEDSGVEAVEVTAVIMVPRSANTGGLTHIECRIWLGW